MNLDTVQNSIDSNSDLQWNYTFYGCYNLSGTVDADKFWNKYEIQEYESKYTFTSCTNLTNYNEIPIQWGGINLGQHNVTLKYLGSIKKHVLSVSDNPEIWDNGYWPYSWCEISFESFVSNPGNLEMVLQPGIYDESIEQLYLKVSDSTPNGTYKTEIQVVGKTTDPKTGELIYSAPSIWTFDIVVNDKIFNMPEMFESNTSWNVMQFDASEFPGGEYLYECLGEYGWGYSCGTETYMQDETWIINYTFEKPSRIYSIPYIGFEWWNNGEEYQQPLIRFEDAEGNEIASTTYSMQNLEITENLPYTLSGRIVFNIPKYTYFYLNQLMIWVEQQ